MQNIVGIDLGTTNSLIAVTKNGIPEVVRDENGNPLLPSIVHFGDQITVGEAARLHMVERHLDTVYSSKRLMGRGLADVQDERSYLGYKLSDLHESVVHIEAGGKLVTPPEVAAHVLKTLRERAEKALGIQITEAVVTVPAYFNDAQRQATRDAGKIAGIKIRRLVNEPTAAALAYGLGELQQGKIAVFDLGGGTFDISVLSVRDGVFQVLSTNGDTHLGGDDFDRVLVDQVTQTLRNQNINAKEDPELMQAIRLEAERAKIALSNQDLTVIKIRNKNLSFDLELTRTDFEKLIDTVLAKTIEPTKQALQDAGLQPNQIDHVVLVGGSTRVPQVQKRVKDLFQKEPLCTLDPQEVVALGAAVQADIMSGARTDLLLLDVIPLSLGIEAYGGAAEKLIFRNSTIPASASSLFSTPVDNQTTVDLHVVQGEREMAKDCRSLARFQLRGIPPMPAGRPRVEVTFQVDENGILQVTAFEQMSGQRAEIDVMPSYGLTESQVDKMVRDSFENAESDFRERMLSEAITEAETLLRHVGKLLASQKDLVSPDDFGKAEVAQQTLKLAVETQDFATIRSAIEQMEKAGEPLVESAMNQVLESTLKS